VQAIDFTIHQADEAARLFGVSPRQVAASLRDANHLDRQARSAHAATTVQGALISVAMTHREDCDRPGCQTCSAIRSALAAHLASLRTLRLEAIERAGRTPPTSTTDPGYEAASPDVDAICPHC
jgi:hypothetical protein